MHPFSVLTLGIFIAGYITARWDLVTRLYELAIFAWTYGVVVSKPHPIPSSFALRRLQAIRLLTKRGLHAVSRHQSICRAHPRLPPHFHPCRTSCDPRGEPGTTMSASSLRPARIPADQPFQAPTFNRIRHICQRATKATGLFLTG